jgi:hypothetical protein
MSNRIAIQDFYSILKYQCPSNKLGRDIYLMNKKKLKYIARTMITTIYDFANTIKIKNTNCDDCDDCVVSDVSDIPKEIIDKTYVDSSDGHIYYTFKGDYESRLKYIQNLLKNFEIEKIMYIIENNLLDMRNYSHYRYNNGREDWGIYGFIDFYVKQYIYFSLLMKDDNLEFQKEISGSSMYIMYKGEKFVPRDKLYNEIIEKRECESYVDYDYTYSHDFQFPHKEINNGLKKKFNRTIKESESGLLRWDIGFRVKNNLLDEKFLKEYTKLCFKMIYYAYFIMRKVHGDEEPDDKTYLYIKECLKGYFI